MADETLLEAFVDFDEDADFKGKDRGSRKQENKRGRMKVARERVRTGPSCPKARVGHRYPCPAVSYLCSAFKVSRAAAPKGTKSCRIQGESVRPVHPSDRSSERPGPASERPKLASERPGLASERP